MTVNYQHLGPVPVGELPDDELPHELMAEARFGVWYRGCRAEELVAEIQQRLRELRELEDRIGQVYVAAWRVLNIPYGDESLNDSDSRDRLTALIPNEIKEINQ